MLSQKVIIEAGKYLSGDNIEEQIVAIMGYCGSLTDPIDFIDNVYPTECFEHSFSIEDFLDMLPFANNNNKIVDDFVWKFVNISEAEKLIDGEIFEVYALYPDNSEALVENIEELHKLNSSGIKFGIEVGCTTDNIIDELADEIINTSANILDIDDGIDYSQIDWTNTIVDFLEKKINFESRLTKAIIYKNNSDGQ